MGKKAFGAYTLNLKTDGPLIAGHMASLGVHVEKNGRPVKDIKPWLGATAHMVGLSGDGKIFVSKIDEAIRIRNDERGEIAL